jgi:four helix bundle protein
MTIRSVEDLDVYRRAYQAAMEVFRLSRPFPKEERHSLTDQIVRSSRSVAANIREGFAKREYENVFLRHLVDALGSAEETQTWLDFAKDCGYLDGEKYQITILEYQEICSMLYALRKNWRKME